MSTSLYRICATGKTGIPIAVWSTSIEVVDDKRFRCPHPFAMMLHFHEEKEQSKFVVQYRMDLPPMVFRFGDVKLKKLDGDWQEFWMRTPQSDAIKTQQMISNNQALAEAVSKIQKHTLFPPDTVA